MVMSVYKPSKERVVDKIGRVALEVSSKEYVGDPAMDEFEITVAYGDLDTLHAIHDAMGWKSRHPMIVWARVLDALDRHCQESERPLWKKGYFRAMRGLGRRFVLQPEFDPRRPVTKT